MLLCVCMCVCTRVRAYTHKDAGMTEVEKLTSELCSIPSQCAVPMSITPSCQYFGRETGKWNLYGRLLCGCKHILFHI